jgi:hypothetical protein
MISITGYFKKVGCKNTIFIPLLTPSPANSLREVTESLRYARCEKPFGS